MKTGNKFAKHLISGVKGSADMKHPRPGVSPNTSVRDILLQCVFKLLFLGFILLSFPEERNSHLFVVTSQLKVLKWKHFKRTKEKLRQNGFLYANDSELGESCQVFPSWWRQLTPPAACLSLTMPTYLYL